MFLKKNAQKVSFVGNICDKILIDNFMPWVKHKDILWVIFVILFPFVNFEILIFRLNNLQTFILS